MCGVLWKGLGVGRVVSRVTTTITTSDVNDIMYVHDSCSCH